MVKILHLYPNLMNLYGDYANITVLAKHLQDQGIKVKVDRKDIDDRIHIENYDLIYMGSGTDSNLFIALNDIVKYKSAIKKFINKGKTLLFTGNAMELLGKYVDSEDGLGIFDFDVEHVDHRFTGDVIVKNIDLGYVVGFINKSSIIKGGEIDKLFEYVFMDDNLQDNNFEGYRKNNVFATHIIGPVLVKNPEFMNEIIKSVAPKNYKFKNIRYSYEVDSYINTLQELKDRL